MAGFVVDQHRQPSDAGELCFTVTDIVGLEELQNQYGERTGQADHGSVMAALLTCKNKMIRLLGKGAVITVAPKSRSST